MVPFSTAERKILGVAAPSQQQTAVNWIYPLPPNPYGLQRRMVGTSIKSTSRRSIRPAFRMPSCKRRTYWPAVIAQAGHHQRLLGAQSQSDRGNREGSSRSWRFCWTQCVDIARRRRDRHHEYPARVRDRADAGDRITHGDRCPTVACAAAVFGPRRCSERQRRDRRHHHRVGIFNRNLGRHRLAGTDLARRHCRRFPVFGGGRHLFRLLPGAKSCSSRSDRSAALRLSTAGACLKRCVPHRQRIVCRNAMARCLTKNGLVFALVWNAMHKA